MSPTRLKTYLYIILQENMVYMPCHMDYWFYIQPIPRSRCTLLKDDDGNYVRFLDCFDKGNTLSPLGKHLVKKYKIRKYQLTYLNPDSVIRIMKDWRNPPALLPDGHLNQKLGYLLDNHKQFLKAHDYFERVWTMEDYDSSRPGYSWKPMSTDDLNLEDFCNDILDIQTDNKGRSLDDYNCNQKWFAEQVVKWLENQGLDIRQLCVWPIWPLIRTDDDTDEPAWEVDMAVAIHKPHVFDYNGRLWHHLGKYLKSGEILGVYADTFLL